MENQLLRHFILIVEIVEVFLDSHDADAKPEDKLQYDVISWYSEASKSY